MHKVSFLLLVLTIHGQLVSSQSLYVPRDIKNAFKKETRSPDGRPGKNYWQNRGRYDIQVTVTPPDRNVKGTEDITYFNNSPDTLKRLNIKLIVNIHRPGAVRNYTADEDYLTSGVEIDNFTVNGTALKISKTDFKGTNQMITLPKALMPHDSVKLTIGWHYPVSVQSGREGLIASNTFYLAYFYPRVSVYDDYRGWDITDFNDAFEFYNDFNDYTLKVTVPKNFLVWATGTLQNAREVLQPEFAKRLEASYTSDSVIHIATEKERANKNVTTQNSSNTWIWKSTNICDVAVGISNQYIWDASSVIVDKKTLRRASVQAAYHPTAKYFPRAVKDAKNSLSSLSFQWPGIPYPFPKMTSFQGFADMEYPMMVNDSDTADMEFGQFVQDHEIAHTYFPFYMGINESRYGFMDEGWATTFEYLMGIQEFGKQTADRNYKAFRIAQWTKNSATEGDLPIITPTSELKSGLGINTYGKPSLSYLALKDLLGDELFRISLHGFMERWNGKHPIPWDFFNSMNDLTKRNFNWFFENWFFSNNYVDISIDNVSRMKEDGYSLSLKNTGGLAVPFDVVVNYADGTTETIHKTPATWQTDSRGTTIAIPTKKVMKSVKIDNGVFMDAAPADNSWTIK